MKAYLSSLRPQVSRALSLQDLQQSLLCFLHANSFLEKKKERKFLLDLVLQLRYWVELFFLYDV